MPQGGYYAPTYPVDVPGLSSRPIPPVPGDFSGVLGRSGPGRFAPGRMPSPSPGAQSVCPYIPFRDGTNLGDGTNPLQQAQVLDQTPSSPAGTGFQIPVDPYTNATYPTIPTSVSPQLPKEPAPKADSAPPRVPDCCC